MLETTREVEGYDGLRGDVKWWFESWGRGSRSEWVARSEMGRPPRPGELADSDYVTLGLEFPDGRVQYRTHIGGIDLVPGRGGSKGVTGATSVTDTGESEPESDPGQIWQDQGWEPDTDVFIDEADYLSYLDEVLNDWLDEFEFGPYQ